MPPVPVVSAIFWDILSVGVAWNATRGRSRTSNHGRFRIVLRVSVSSLVIVIVYMGHVIPYDATSASSDRMAGTGGIYRMGPCVRYLVVGECNINETGRDRDIVNRDIMGQFHKWV